MASWDEEAGRKGKPTPQTPLSQSWDPHTGRGAIPQTQPEAMGPAPQGKPELSVPLKETLTLQRILQLPRFSLPLTKPTGRAVAQGEPSRKGSPLTDTSGMSVPASLPTLSLYQQTARPVRKASSMREKDEDKCTEENKHQRKQSKLSEKYSKNTPINILTDI